MVRVERAGHESLNAELEEAVRQYQELKGRIASLLDGLSLEQFNWRPTGDRWSIAQNLQHLSREAGESVPVIEALIERGQREHTFGDGAFQHGRFANWWLGFLEPPYKVKIKTFARYTPPSSLTFAETVPELMNWHDRFIDLACRANGLDLARLKGRLTYFKPGMPSLSLGQLFRYIAAHERRHLWQIERHVLAAEGFPAKA